MAYKFEDKFVHFRWDDSLKGKKVFYADSIGSLEDDVAEGKDYGLLIRASGSKDYPFLIKGDEEEETPTNWKFVYYDPNYECKIACEKGKTIQFKCQSIWMDIEGIPAWNENCEYRIKPEGTYCVIVGVSSRLIAIEKSSVKEGVHVFYESDSLEDCLDWIATRRKIEDVMIAYAEGKAVEFLNVGNIWCQASTPEWRIGTEYRIKTKGYRAFKNTDELKKKWEELCPTSVHRPSLCEPLIWVKCKWNGITVAISRFAGDTITMNVANYNMDELFEYYTFLDGTPCGMEKEE